jgi:hypothetical protein
MSQVSRYGICSQLDVSIAFSQPHTRRDGKRPLRRLLNPHRLRNKHLAPTPARNILARNSPRAFLFKTARDAFHRAQRGIRTSGSYV